MTPSQALATVDDTGLVDGAAIQTYTGVLFNPFHPRPEDIDIRDIAHALSQQCRFGGHSKTLYSVAQHCLLVSKYLPAPFKLWGLLHDASEAYLVDIPKPIKNFLPDYLDIEYRLEQEIARAFGLRWPVPAEVKVIDQRILATERRDLMRPGPEWQGLPEPFADKIDPLQPPVAEYRFLTEFYNLTGGDRK